jgi:hypothetical protein
LQKKNKLYGPKNVLDYENTSSSWNSEGILNGGESEQTQYLVLEFGPDVVALPQLIRLQFQAGFGCEQCHIYGSRRSSSKSSTLHFDIDASGNEWIKICSLDLLDVHEVQTHEVPLRQNENRGVQYCTALRIVFDDFADFYKRIIVYRLEIWGDLLYP